nr:MAG: RNA-dependent RNA polymerase [Porcine picobirnavirus]
MSKCETKSESEFYKYFDLPNPGLRSYFDGVVKGNSEIYHSPWIKSESNEGILRDLKRIMQEWMPHLKTLAKEWPSLYEFEEDLAAKVGPMSVKKPLKERMDDIEAYYDGILLPAEPVAETAIQKTIYKFRKAKGLRLRSQERTADLMKKSTNSGAPYFLKRRQVVGKTLPCELASEGRLQVLHHCLSDEEKFNVCAILGWRGQEGGPKPEDVKQRVVFMFPFAVNILELQVYQPLIEVFQRFNYVPAWVSMDEVDRSITRLFDTKGHDDVVICTDFSKFDQHFNGVMQDAAKSILSGILTPSHESKEWLKNVFPVKYNIPLAYDWSCVRTGKHGMGSGSGGTNADETLAHTALQIEAATQHGSELNPNSMCLGDDGVLTYPGITVEDVVQSYTSHGLEMNPDKQYVSKHDCVYLRRWHHQNYRVDGVCVGVYSTARALGRLCMQERFYDPEDWGPKMVALRELSIIENCKNHPLFEEFADFCMKRDKFRLGLDIPGFLDNIDKEAKKATDNMPDFLGYTKTLQKADKGISDWRIVKYLKSKL